MSPSLRFDFDPVEQSAAIDLVERNSWCGLSIKVGDRFVSSVWDRHLKSERKTLYVPAFPIAEWLVRNWWSLFYEGCRWDKVPQIPQREREWQWIHRHCLRSADSSLMLPSFYLYNDGKSLRAEWYADQQDSMPNMPGEFISQGAESLDLQDTLLSVENFINKVLDRASHRSERRVADLTTHWKAIQAADTAERDFCIYSGRMGIDPYDREVMTEEFASFIETFAEHQSRLLISDLTDVADETSLPSQWSWLQNITQLLNLTPLPSRNISSVPESWWTSPPLYGYHLASIARAATNQSEIGPIHSVEEIASQMLPQQGGIRFENRNHVPGEGIRAVVGLSAVDNSIVAAGPLPSRSDNLRFLKARCLYYAIANRDASQRLVTNAYSWDQKASRAFAAELLAPRQALQDALAFRAADVSAIEDLSQKFNVSTIVVEKQLENFGITVVSE